MSVIFGRVLRVVFYSNETGDKIQYSTEDESRSLVIEISGTKYLSLMKDEFVIDIYNLTYSEVLRLIKLKYDSVEIYAGYQTASVSRIFKGKVFYISMGRESRETSIAHIICVSEMVGVYNSKLNLSLNSGINMYAAVNYALRKSGVRDINLSEQLKRRYLQELDVHKGSSTNIIQDLLSSYSRFSSQVDSSSNASVSIWDLKRSDRRKIRINTKNGMVINGPPTLTTDGLRFESLPVLNYMPGDILLIDNSIILMTITSLQEAQTTNLGLYLSKMNEEGLGEYLLYKIDYSLSNRDGDFKVTLLAKTASLLEGLLGG